MSLTTAGRWGDWASVDGERINVLVFRDGELGAMGVEGEMGVCSISWINQ